MHCALSRQLYYMREIAQQQHQKLCGWRFCARLCDVKTCDDEVWNWNLFYVLGIVLAIGR